MPTITLKFSTKLSVESEFEAIGWLWVLRIYNSGRVTLSNHESMHPPFHLLPILEKYCEDENGSTEKGLQAPHVFSDIISNELKLFEAINQEVNHIITDNIQMIANAFNLNEIEREILTFRTVFRLHQGLESTLEGCITERWTENIVHQILAIALQKPIEQVAKALSQDSQLIKSKLVSFEDGLKLSFGNKFAVMEGLISAINTPAKDVISLMSFVLKPTPASSLQLDDYSHHEQEVSLLKSYLAKISKNKVSGTNILLHGMPGVGKTELARLLANELELQAFEVQATSSGDETLDEDGKLHQRFRYYQIMQNLLSQLDKSMIIFDEIEDVIPQRGVFEKSSSGRKAWLNDLLESNPVPAIWISNHVSQIDPAMMRRFDFILEVRNLNINKRIELLKNTINSHNLNHQWIAKVAESNNLTPAIAQRIMKVIENADIQEPKAIQMHFEKQMNERNSAQGIYKQSRYPKPEVFDVSLLNTNIDIEKLVARAGKLSNAKVLLYGPPGTGKTALAHHIAEISNKPLLQKRSSDLVSAFLGETELNLKRMFDEASSAEALLFLDEADSFLQSRAHTSHQWEVSQVNELLTQMEAYQGIFICATNFMEHLDIASLRRFQFKVKFEYLNAQQVMKHFEWLINQTSAIRISENIEHHKSRLIKLKNLTPADFRTVLEQFQMLEETPTEPMLFDELKNLSELKNDGNKNIGFLH